MFCFASMKFWIAIIIVGLVVLLVSNYFNQKLLKQFNQTSQHIQRVIEFNA